MNLHSLVINEVSLAKQSITPSLLAEGIRCRRKIWLIGHHVDIWDDQEGKHEYRTLRYFITNNPRLKEEANLFQYELPFPDGTRIDGWIRQENVVIEYKSGLPHISHIYQTWFLWMKLIEWVVTDVQIQLWYPPNWQNEAIQLARSVSAEWKKLSCDCLAIRIDPPDESTTYKIIELQNELLETMTQPMLPEIIGSPNGPVCRSCTYHDWCHILNEQD